jgi:hypothetical protein
MDLMEIIEGYERRAGRRADGMGYVMPVRCRDCAHARVERHTGDEQLVCWKRPTHGEAVPADGYCHDGVAR